MSWFRKKRIKKAEVEVSKIVVPSDSLRERVHAVGEYIRRDEIIELLKQGFCCKEHSNEEATKQLSVIPFLRALGYENQGKVVIFPETLIDPNNAGGKKVDYAIFVDGQVRIIAEVKAFIHELDKPRRRKKKEELPVEQLAKYFEADAFASAEYAILTNGKEYRFYCQSAESAALSAPRKMSQEPFLTIDLSEKETEYNDTLEAVALQGYVAANDVACIKSARIEAVDAKVKEVLSSVSATDEIICAIRHAAGCSEAISDDELLGVVKRYIQ